MSVLIHGLEMPQEGFVEILIREDGTVQQTGQSYRIDGTDYYTPYVGEMPVIYKAVPVPPHGRLIDADTFDERIRVAGGLADEELSDDFKDGVQTTLLMLKTHRTIIPAEEGET